jgi:hypothetical protein
MLSLLMYFPNFTSFRGERSDLSGRLSVHIRLLDPGSADEIIQVGN